MIHGIATFDSLDARISVDGRFQLRQLRRVATSVLDEELHLRDRSRERIAGQYEARLHR